MSTTQIEDDSPPGAAPSRDVVGELGRFGVPIVLLALTIVFSVLLPDSFASSATFRSIAGGQAVIVLLALGIMMPLIVGQLDLSNATMLATSQILVLGLMAHQGLSVGLAIPLTLAFAATVGLVNGFLIVRLQIPAFVATLAVASFLYGAQLLYTEAATIIDPQPESFTQIGRADIGGIPAPAIIATAIAALLWLVLSFLPVGRRLYATGGNPRAAMLSGIPTQRYLIGAFVSSSMLAATAGILLGAQIATGTPTLGLDLLFPAITGAFLGATTIKPGRFNVLGTIAAVLTLAVTVAGLQGLGAEVWVEPMFNGVTLIGAVALSGWAFQRKAARMRALQLRQLAQEAADAAPAKSYTPN